MAAGSSEVSQGTHERKDGLVVKILVCDSGDRHLIHSSLTNSRCNLTFFVPQFPIIKNGIILPFAYLLTINSSGSVSLSYYSCAGPAK